MPTIASTDGTKLYYEEAGSGTPIVFVHEFAGDYRTWEPQLRHFARGHRCVTFSARGYPPSEVPSDPARYGQDVARGDVVALLDGLGIRKAHVVGHSMGAYTALHVGDRRGLRLGLGCRSGGARVDAQACRRDRRDVHREGHG
jgi:pimeloyl-ACP methyl ester carboxylesterase